ncbi:MAG: thiamine-phosphate pyrophosphorylase [Solirubrobacteraceae bacterium]|jgi:thiamine-phosphate pyrophosphorylase|nr:thiamine-phosphate pyrophosphorylase [Solirubrobacteraceae bacterium]
MSVASARRDRLDSARLYLICGLRPGGRALEDVLGPALAGGVDIVQLRDKRATDAGLLAAAAVARRLCDGAGALLILNDRPDLVTAANADGCHVGQDDMDLEEARALAGPDALVGRSTHSPQDIENARGADYIGVGPVHATPTKPGRPAVGLGLVRHAAEHAPMPFFAIGGIDGSNVGAVVDAGARRIAVVRAIADATDPEGAAATLRRALTRQAVRGLA